MSMNMKNPLFCPITYANNQVYNRCLGEDCAWWCSYANDCAIQTIAVILADSSICRSIFEKDAPEEKPEPPRFDSIETGCFPW